jgi:hypothetical protein
VGLVQQAQVLKEGIREQGYGFVGEGNEQEL